MERIRGALRRVFIPPLWLTPLIVAPCFALLVWCLREGRSDVVAHIIYQASVYGLVVLITAGVRVARGLSARVQGSALRGNPLVRLLMDDLVLRTKLALLFSMGMNLLYAVVKLSMGIYLRSLWLFFLGLYYLVLAFLRFVILRSDQRSPIGVDHGADLRRCRLCGVILLLINQLMACVVILATRQSGTFDYPGPLIYLVACYAFYALIHAVVKLTQLRKAHSPLLSAAKAVSLTAAMVSMLSLEVALTTRFGGTDVEFSRHMTAVLGGVICTFELFMAVYIIARTSRALKRL